VGLVVSRYLVVTEPVISPRDGRPRRILFATRSGQVRSIADGLWESVGRGELDALPADIHQGLTEAGILVDSADDELAAILAENRAEIDRPVRLTLVVHPTAACQLACAYCGQRHRSRTLSPPDQESLIQRVESQLSAGAGRYRELEVGWFGGEPLLGLDVMRALSPKLRALAGEFGCAYSADVVTNALLLTPDVAAELAAVHGVSYAEVTLDGTAEYHDRRRCTRDGSPTFAKIFQNLTAILAPERPALRIGIRANVDRENQPGVVPLLELLAERQLHARIDRFYVAPVRAWGEPAAESSAGAAEFASWEVECFAHMLRLGFQVEMIPSRKRVVCLAVCPGAEVVDAFGSLFNCTEVSYVPAYEARSTADDRSVAPGGCQRAPCNTYAIGSVAGGEDLARRACFADLNDRIQRREIPCHACAMLPVCGGACPKQWRVGDPLCPPYKLNMPQRLALGYYMRVLGGRPQRVTTGGLQPEGLTLISPGQRPG
jgi:uncharacterized protein